MSSRRSEAQDDLAPNDSTVPSSRNHDRPRLLTGCRVISLRIRWRKPHHFAGVHSARLRDGRGIMDAAGRTADTARNNEARTKYFIDVKTSRSALSYIVSLLQCNYCETASRHGDVNVKELPILRGLRNTDVFGRWLIAHDQMYTRKNTVEGGPRLGGPFRAFIALTRPTRPHLTQAQLTDWTRRSASSILIIYEHSRYTADLWWRF
jgi:hypothetical protein